MDVSAVQLLEAVRDGLEEVGGAAIDKNQIMDGQVFQIRTHFVNIQRMVVGESRYGKIKAIPTLSVNF